MEGVIEETLPKGMFTVRLDSGAKLRVTISTAARRTIVTLLRGDRVFVERSPYDPNRGRITAKL